MRDGSSRDRPGGAVALLGAALEALWLTAVATVPLAMAPPGAMLTYIQLPKVVLLRTVAALIVMVWALAWALGSGSWRVRRPFEGPARWIIAGVLAYGLANVASALASVSPRASLWGRLPAHDGYSLYTLGAYLVVFAAVALNVRRREQVLRLLWTVALTGLAASALALTQAAGLTTEPLGGRVDGTFGNPIFLGAFLTMTTPVTLALALGSPWPRGEVPRLALGSAALGLQMAALALSLSRGPWLGTAAALGVLLGLLLAFHGVRPLLKGGVVVATGLALALAVVALPRATPPGGLDEETAPAAVTAVAERALSLVDGRPSASVEGRLAIWRAAGRLALQRPEAVTGPALGPLRHLLGYGPDTFAYVFPMVASSEVVTAVGLPEYAHNLLLQRAVELGVLGLSAYLFLLGALLVSGLVALKGRGYVTGAATRAALAGSLAALTGHMVEQAFGIAQAGDTTLFWALVGLVAALVSRRWTGVEAKPVGGRRTHAQPSLRRCLAAALVVSGMLFLLATRGLNYAAADALAAAARREIPSDPRRATELVDLAVGLAPDSPLYREERVRLLRALFGARGTTEALAREVYQERVVAYETYPASPELVLRAANAALELAWQGRRDKAAEAVALYERLADMAPGFDLSHLLLATALLETGRPRSAIEVLDAFLQESAFDRRRPQALLLRGMAHRQLGLRRQAIDDARASLASTNDAALRDEARRLLRDMGVAEGGASLAEE